MHLFYTAGAICGAVIAIAGVLFGFYRAARFLARLDDALPVLLDVAAEFKPNGGNSLHDRMERLELGQRALLMDRGYATLDDFVAVVKHPDD